MKRISILIILILLVLTTIFFFYNQSKFSILLKQSGGVHFTGIITETNNGCWADGICSIKIDDKWIVSEIGGLRPPNAKPEIRGQLIGISFAQDTEKYIGKKAEVYAKQENNSYTIYGNSNFYIKLLD